VEGPTESAGKPPEKKTKKVGGQKGQQINRDSRRDKAFRVGRRGNWSQGGRRQRDMAQYGERSPYL